VTPAGAGTAKASEAAQTGTATAASPSATPGVSQQGQIIGVRTLLEFVAWLVCASLKDSSASTAHGKLRADALPAGPARRGAAFLTEELSSVGVAVRRMQVSNCLSFILYLTVWGVEPVVTHQTSWLESTGVIACQSHHVVAEVRVQCSAVNLTPGMTSPSGR